MNSRIAALVADALFTNGNGDKAERLVLVQNDEALWHGRDLGGWSRDGAIAEIAKVLAAHRPAPESPVLAFQAWVARYVADHHRLLTQDEYFLAQTAFFAAHPGHGPTSEVMAAPASEAPATTREETPDPPHVREDYREVWLSGWRAGRSPERTETP